MSYLVQQTPLQAHLQNEQYPTIGNNHNRILPQNQDYVPRRFVHAMVLLATMYAVQDMILQPL